MDRTTAKAASVLVVLKMKNFLIGFLAALAVIACFLFGVLFIFGEKVEKRLNTSWEAKEETELKLTIYPSVDIELSDALGLNAQEMADFLSQGNQQKEESYRSILDSGLSIEIVSYHESDGPDRTQKVYFKEGKVGNHILETSVDIQLIPDEIPDSSIRGSSQLSEAIEKLRSRAELQRSGVELLQKETEAGAGVGTAR